MKNGPERKQRAVIGFFMCFVMAFIGPSHIKYCVCALVLIGENVAQWLISDDILVFIHLFLWSRYIKLLQTMI